MHKFGIIFSCVTGKKEKYCDHGDYSAEIHKEFTNEKAVINFDELLEDPWDCVKSTEKSSVAINMRNKVYSVTKADAVQSAASFDSLLTDKVWLRQFHKFLKFEYSEENIEFWIACEEFETVGTNELVATANKIYDTFIATFSPKEVNLDSKTRLEISINLDNPTRDLFKQAQKYVRLLLENDSYKRFLDSDIYRQFIADRCINSGY